MKVFIYRISLVWDGYKLMLPKVVKQTALKNYSWLRTSSVKGIII